MDRAIKKCAEFPDLDRWRVRPPEQLQDELHGTVRLADRSHRGGSGTGQAGNAQRVKRSAEAGRKIDARRRRVKEMETNDVVTIVRTELSGEGALFKTRHVGKTDIVTGVPNSRNRAGGYAGSLQLRNREPTECRKDALRLGSFFWNAHGAVSLMQLVEPCCARFLPTSFLDSLLAGDRSMTRSNAWPSALP
jgi:hypothetical protein